MNDEALGGKLLEGVSRSFYLTLKALPGGVREPISLAYLLARAADTLADTPHVEAATKSECLAEFGRLVQVDERDGAGEETLCARLRQEFVPHQEDEAEKKLLERLPEAFEAFWRSPERLQKPTRAVLDPIVKGQLLDIQRFPVDGLLRSLTTAAELDEYTWLVAGCVGEFWTRVSEAEVKGAFQESAELGDLVAWGIRYGKGLQLVNMLRDVGKDARMGRCYLPVEQLAAHGISLAGVRTKPSLLRPVMERWIRLCREHLECGLKYLDAVQSRRLRFATALPLLLGIRTLARISKASPEELEAGVKVPRAEVAKLLVETGVANLRQNGLRRMGEREMAAMA